MIIGLKAVMRNAVDGWRTEATKEFIAQKVASRYHKIRPDIEDDPRRGELLKVPSEASAKNNMQNFFRVNERTSIESKATMMDLLPAIISVLPTERACAALNQFLNPLGYSVAAIGANPKQANRDQLLAAFSKESGEAFRSVLLLSEHATIDQLRSAYKEVQESEGVHEPLLGYLENLIAQKG